MAIIRLTKKFDFEMAHALKDYDGLCAHLHGHSYRLEVTVVGEPMRQPGHSKNGMVMDFSDLKKIVKEDIVDHCDHALMLNKEQETEIPPHDANSALWKKTILVDYQPTSENMLIDFAQRIEKRLPKSVKLHHLVLHETANSSSEWWAEEQG
ncbi:MAG: 6-carboxytetrahydropterin synthase QueD [Bacteroidales bacterium]|nr:6-carboxytetrahydropterin synthase QueD [Bacteroidales bacterium]